jgi:hypothetical protein
MIGSIADGLGFWVWIILGLALVTAEAVAPGIFLIWFGLAAILTGLADAGFGLSWQAAVLVFAGLSVAAVLLGRAVTGGPRQVSREGDLNRRDRISSAASSSSTRTSPMARAGCGSAIRPGGSPGRTRPRARRCGWCGSRAGRWWSSGRERESPSLGGE